MWVDFDGYVIGLPLCHSKENTGQPDVFDVTAQRSACEDPDLDDFIDNLNDWD